MHEQVEEKADNLRIWLTFWIAVIGIAVMAIAFFFALFLFEEHNRPGEVIPAVLGVVSGAVGTLAGLVAGHNAGAHGKERAERLAHARQQEGAAGRALAEALKAEEAMLEGRDTPSAARASAPDAEPIRRLAELARRLFPA